MNQAILIGIAAGIAAVLLFAAPLSSGSLAIPLYILASLPIAIATLGWGVVAGGTGAATAALGVGAFVAWSLSGSADASQFSAWKAAAIYLCLSPLPILWVARLALLSRTTEDGKREWYPLGRLLFHAAAAVSVGLILAGLILPYDPAKLTREIVAALTSVAAENPDIAGTVEPAGIDATARTLVALTPFSLAFFGLILLVLNLWIAAIVARASGRFERPKEPVWTAEPPKETAFAFLAAAVLTLLPGVAGDAAAAVASAFGGAMLLLGLAVLHAVTIGNAARGWILAFNYLLIFFVGVPLLIFPLVGLAETFFHLRARRFRGAPPST